MYLATKIYCMKRCFASKTDRGGKRGVFFLFAGVRDTGGTRPLTPAFV